MQRRHRPKVETTTGSDARPAGLLIFSLPGSEPNWSWPIRARRSRLSGQQAGVTGLVS